METWRHEEENLVLETLACVTKERAEANMIHISDEGGKRIR